MLSVSSYSQEYVDECRGKIDVQLSAYKNLVTTATDPSRANEVSEARLESAIAEFEPLFFNNMLLMLDNLLLPPQPNHGEEGRQPPQ